MKRAIRRDSSTAAYNHMHYTHDIKDDQDPEVGSKRVIDISHDGNRIGGIEMRYNPETKRMEMIVLGNIDVLSSHIW